MAAIPELNSWPSRLVRAHWPPLLAAAGLLLHCLLVSGSKPMWMDEVLTYYPTSMPTFGQLRGVVNDKINVGHQAYFLLVWLWSGLFSDSPLSLRLFSSVCMGVGLLFTWLTLRRACGFWPAAVAVPLVFCNASLVLEQNVEARFYGLLLAASALLLHVSHVTRHQRRFTWTTALGLFALHGVLPLVHLFGFVYSAIFLVAVFVHDRISGYSRPWVYIAAVAGWSAFLPFLPAFRRQLELSQPHYWIPQPEWMDLLRVYANGRWFLVFLALTLILIVIMRLRLRPESVPRPLRSGNNAMLPLLALGFLSLPAVVWLQSQWGRPLFMPRYVIIFELGWAILLALALATVLPPGQELRLAVRRVLTGLVIVMVAALILRAIDAGRRELVLPADELLALSEKYPVITDDTHFYLQASYYHPQLSQFYFVLDWRSALASDIANDTQDYQAMKALRRHVPQLGIRESSQLLAKLPEFVLYRSRHWLASLQREGVCQFQPLGSHAMLVRRCDSRAPAPVELNPAARSVGRGPGGTQP